MNLSSFLQHSIGILLIAALAAGCAANGSPPAPTPTFPPSLPTRPPLSSPPPPSPSATPKPTFAPPAQPPPAQPKAMAAACRPDEFSPSGVLRSTDHGATWIRLGRICLHDPALLPVDFTAIPWDGGVALYFIDMKLLHQPASVERILYRATSTDGVNFDRPQEAVTAAVDMFDPAAIRTLDGRVRLYVPMDDPSLSGGLASFISDDGLHFSREAGARNANGGMPGALVLADGRVRIFTGGPDQNNQPGLLSYISADGLAFTQEDGLRIAAAGRKQTEMPGDPAPIRLLAGGYLMAFMINPSDPFNPVKAQYRLAASADGLAWQVNPAVFAEGGTSSLVEVSDGTLYFYYGQ
jgi:hypothetical protein